MEGRSLSLVSGEVVVLLAAMAANLALYLSSLVGESSMGPPLDRGLSLGGRRLVGDGRRLLGLTVALGAAVPVAAVLGKPWLGLLAAVGVDMGTVVHSAIKRRRGLPRGARHWPWDHVDFVIGALLVYGLHYRLGPVSFMVCTLLGGLVHALASRVLRPLLDHREW